MRHSSILSIGAFAGANCGKPGDGGCTGSGRDTQHSLQQCYNRAAGAVATAAAPDSAAHRRRTFTEVIGCLTTSALEETAAEATQVRAGGPHAHLPGYRSSTEGQQSSTVDV